ncbi:inactive transglutaminase family protein [Pontibacterium sp. N1Y112]|uniref:Inactive transglutaminase family protein n=1 Tax=Pontibacterium sinense TaxID=2781979 RepID=A0A8J7FN87_9GAMM|nr:inactive transglutaminase family protein [Pontibacterium sinense]MBE9399418.1 inactive transglutaminase family protein [Pontibacterium sinense]
MQDKIPYYLLVTLLIAVGFGSAIYRHINLDIPWLPGETREVWRVEARLEFTADGDAIVAQMAIPESHPGFTLLEQATASPGYGLSYLTEEKRPAVRWSTQQASGKQVLYYRAQFLLDDKQEASWPPSPDISEPPILPDPISLAAGRLIEQAKKQSANQITMAAQLINGLRSDDQQVQLLKQDRSLAAAALILMQLAEIPAREVTAIRLKHNRRNQDSLPYLMVYAEDQVAFFNLTNGKEGRPERLLIWEMEDQPLIDLEGGHNTRVSFSMLREVVPVQKALEQKYRDVSAMQVSLHSLPQEEQQMFRGLLLIPVGVMVVMIIRVLVGLRTSGTFMPVLIALALMQTSLGAGLAGFVLVVVTGLVVRGYLSRLNLLLVARISAVIIVVILLTATFSVIAYNLRIVEGLNIIFFPMIIIAWTIERMSLLWEEEGGEEVMKQGGGSLFVALLAYLVMSNGYIQHLTFNFPGLQLVLLALILILGSYTGYRLIELVRFSPFASRSQEPPK